jgi:phosphatidylglycerophosphatase A
MKRLVKLLATFFYLGEIPLAPGTMGSLGGFFLFLSTADRPSLCIVVFVLITAVGFLTAGRAERIFGKKDPRQVVIDEVAGIFLVYFMVPLKIWNLLSGFLLYRALDIAKPFPAKQLERLPGSLGIMSDDLLCGLYANLILQVLLRLHLLY